MSLEWKHPLILQEKEGEKATGARKVVIYFALQSWSLLASFSVCKVRIVLIRLGHAAALHME